MHAKNVTISNRLGMHARASYKMVNMASLFQSDIVLLRRDGELDEKTHMMPADQAMALAETVFEENARPAWRSESGDYSMVDAKSMMEVMLFSAEIGTNMWIFAHGSDETDAVNAIVNMVANGFDETY